MALAGQVFSQVDVAGAEPVHATITQADLDPRPGDFAIPADFDLPVSGPDEPPINPFTIDEQGPTPFDRPQDRAAADDGDGW